MKLRWLGAVMVLGTLSLPFVGFSAQGSVGNSGASSAEATQGLQNPAQFLAGFVSDLKHEILKDQLSLANSPDKLYALVQAEVLPHLDLDQMAGVALGPKWREATEDQKKAFIDQFSKMVTRNYSAGLLKVSDYTFKLYPIRESVWKRENRVSINGVIQPNSGGAGSNVTYYLERDGDTWKIYDLAIEGISFVSNYRSQFESYPSVQAIIPAIQKLNEQVK